MRVPHNLPGHCHVHIVRSDCLIVAHLDQVIGPVLAPDVSNVTLEAGSLPAQSSMRETGYGGMSGKGTISPPVSEVGSVVASCEYITKLSTVYMQSAYSIHSICKVYEQSH
jgi:hypothetical protein